MLIDDENLFETEAGGGQKNIDRNCFSPAQFFFIIFHTVDKIFSGLPSSPQSLSPPSFSLKNYFPMIFAGIPNEVILLPRSVEREREREKRQKQKRKNCFPSDINFLIQ
jgi:hypothetical protein